MTSEQLFKLRTALGLSQQELAAALNLKTFATINRWENEHRDIPQEEARLLECLEQIVAAAEGPKSRFTVQEVAEAVKTSGVANVVAKSASAGVLPVAAVSALAALPAFYWLGGLLGLGAGAVATSFFQKLHAREKSKKRGANQ